MPLSIIIVGVGMADFETMTVLDADDAPLEYHGKRYVVRMESDRGKRKKSTAR